MVMKNPGALWNIAQFKPVQLLKTEVEVLASHPNTADSAPDIKPDILQVMRHRLLSTPDEEIPVFARGLSPKELIAILHLLSLEEEDSKVIDRGKKVIWHRQRRDLVIRAWRLFLNHYPIDSIQFVLRLLVSRHRCFWMKNQDNAAKWDKWLSAKSVTREILKDIEASGIVDIEEFIENLEIPRGSSLEKALWREILVEASALLIRKIGASTLMRRAQEEQEKYQRRFASNYLCRLKKRSEWTTQVLSWIRDKYNVPRRRDNQNHFWQNIPEEIRTEYLRWANETKIREFFERIHDPHGRFLFWKDFMDQIEQVDVVVENQAMVMDFGHFGVVEFSEVGNAAYIYNRKHFAAIRNIHFYAPASAYKNAETAYNRIIHRSGWQYDWRGIIKDLLRRRS